MLMRYSSVFLALFVVAYVLKGGELLFGFLNLTLVFLWISLGGSLLHCVINQRIKYQFSWADIAVIALALVMLANTVNNEGVEKALRFLVLVVLPFFLARFLLVNPVQIKSFLFTILVASSIIALFVFADSVGPDITNSVLLYRFVEDSENRLLFQQVNPIALAIFFMTGAMLYIGLLPAWKFHMKLFAYVMIGVCLYSLFLTGTRGAIVAIAVTLTLLLIFGLLKHPFKTTSIAFILTLLGSVVIILVFRYSPIVIEHSLWDRYRIPLYTLLENGQNLDNSINERLSLYNEAITKFLENPLSGAGVGGMEMYAHNIFLETAAELGVIGLLPLCILLILVLRNLFKYLLRIDDHKLNYLTAVYLVTISLLVEKQFSTSLTQHKDLFTMFAIILNFPLLFNTIDQSSTNQIKQELEYVR